MATYRDRGRARPSIEIPGYDLSPEDRKRAELWRLIYWLQIAFPELTCRQARRTAGHWTMLRRWVRRDRNLPADAPAALLTLCVVLGWMWLPR